MAKKYQYGIPVVERIRDWLMDGTGRRKLSVDDGKVWGRMQTLRSLLTEKAYSIHDAMPVILNSYDISEATYWRDVRGLFSLFGDILESNRQAQKFILYELGMKSFQMAAKKEDAKAMAAAHRNLITLLGFDKEEPDKIDPEKLNPGMYALVIEEDTRKLFHALLNRGSVDLSELLKTSKQVETIDIDHEELPGASGSDQS